MNSRKLFSLILGVFTLAVVVSVSPSSTNHRRGDGQVIGRPSQPQIANGGGPAPPYPPPKPNFGMLVADGGGPAPPYPPPNLNFGALIADGGGPAPPYPKPPLTTFGSMLAV